MSHVNLTRFAHEPEDAAETFHRVQSVASAMSEVEGVISSRAFASAGTVILFVEHSDFGAIDRVRAHSGAHKARMEGLSTLRVVGQEWWSGAPTC